MNINDQYEGFSQDELKATLVLRHITSQFPVSNTVIKFGDEFSHTVDKRTKTQKYGRYSWTTTHTTLNITLASDWYQETYLRGIGSVKYKGKTCVPTECEELPESALRDDFRGLGLTPYKVKLLMVDSKYDRKLGSTLLVDTEDRFMVATQLSQGNASKCYAAQHINAAASNLVRYLEKAALEAMGV